jgi:four helix bundle protein
MKNERFEDLKAWQEAPVLAKMVYRVTTTGGVALDFRLRCQIRAAAGSVIHNIAEGFDAGSDAEFVRFLRRSRRSSSEVQSQRYAALDQQYLEPDQFRLIYDQATKTKRLINSFIACLTQPTTNSQPAPGRPTSRPADQPTQ